ncbi:MAG: multicopper oxidase domain-containing protein [Thermodesulfobacteriota bacterium]
MSFRSPAFHIDRITAVGEEAEFVKAFDPRPVGTSPPLPEPLRPTNPVPEVMQALGLSSVSTPHTVALDLLSGLDINTWDGAKRLHFMTFRDTDLKSPFAGPVYPGPTLRVPRGVIFHADANGIGPPPHTVHWHGIEPTAINDGVGHCSMEIGHFVYQWQPNTIGTFFYHCHRATVQHFEFGLFGGILLLPPDAYFASIASTNPDDSVNLNAIPVGAGTDGRFRTAANLLTLPPAVQSQFPGFVAGDPVYGVAGANDVGVGHPHAFTVPYDVEVVWVPDDRDSVWSDLASDAFQTFPIYGDTPGFNDDFHANDKGGAKFFAFNDFHADYWFVTGVPVPAHRGGTATIDPASVLPGGLIPPALNGGVLGTQIAVNAQVGQTILIRYIDGAYNTTTVTFPVDVVIIAWDGYSLGVPPFGLYNEAIPVPANTPILVTSARRFDALIYAKSPINSFATIKFMDTRGNDLLVTAQIPFVIV